MNLCDDTLTLYNRRHDPANDRDVYHRTVISGISWYSTVKSTVTERGLKSANLYTIRIPLDADFNGKNWIDPKGYTEAGDVSNLFTLNEGDLIVKGKVSLEITVPAQIHQQFSEAFTVLSVTDNRRALNAKHWKVVGA